ncbi:MAG: hypothetical protein ACLQBD_27685 [Syntrophobacteraceae bacterium]
MKAKSTFIVAFLVLALLVLAAPRGLRRNAAGATRLPRLSWQRER